MTLSTTDAFKKWRKRSIFKDGCHRRMRISLLTLMIVLFSCQLLTGQSTTDQAPEDTAQRYLILVRGVDGNADYQRLFSETVEQWRAAAKAAGMRTQMVERSDGSPSSRQQLQDHLRAAVDVDELWVVLIGHGTFDGQTAKFNLQGEDVSAKELGSWLKDRTKTTVVINNAASSAPFITELTGPNRILITSTKSGYEMSFAHFGRYLAELLTEENIDLDKDNRTSLLEAVIVAAGRTMEFYQSDSRLPTEHALVDDNGDGLGTPVEWYRGVQVNREIKVGEEIDGIRANQIFLSPGNEATRLTSEQIEERDQLERELETLRRQKKSLTEAQYYQKLEAIMLRLGKLYLSPLPEQIRQAADQ